MAVELSIESTLRMSLLLQLERRISAEVLYQAGAAGEPHPVCHTGQPMVVPGLATDPVGSLLVFHKLEADLELAAVHIGLLLHDQILALVRDDLVAG